MHFLSRDVVLKSFGIGNTIQSICSFGLYIYCNVKFAFHQHWHRPYSFSANISPYCCFTYVTENALHWRRDGTTF